MLQPHDLHGSPWENRWFPVSGFYQPEILSSSDALGGEVQAMSATGLDRSMTGLVFGALWMSGHDERAAMM